ncbi:2'-5' RNA ligase family protein [Dactylosporangium sp. NPDC051541]|uniref:2'-5' RNA ligase family protein n=1 Tax=Dactylosporangium sp. NPDC051541 TaxID=3363977 RepID=UPI00378DE0E0
MTPQQEDWERFSSLKRMQNHWDRPDWTPGRQAYYWYLTWDSAPLRELADQCQRALRSPYLDLVPLDALHLTMPKLAWADQISSDVLGQAVDNATDLCAAIESFTIKVGPLAGSAGAVRFSVDPWPPILELSRRLTEANPLGENHSSAEFRPHIGVAYCNSDIAAHPVIARVEQLRGLPQIEVQVTAVELVLLRREGRSYRWSTFAEIQLARFHN